MYAGANKGVALMWIPTNHAAAPEKKQSVNAGAAQRSSNAFQECAQVKTLQLEVP